MARPKYTCSQCGKISGLPDFCCGKSMALKGSFSCKACGSSSSVSGECCGQPMQQL
ncbi:hypothetical protein [Phosphitispora fastidiosa]|uniref:hypothetical protein n=1 Tax=Phosphitispora fastidiosa TaxID=2837202 RepID=UPI001E55BC33|nr:hypothetical protein [Phosphitispora fastidiosa]MBU7007981.1 DNA-directed RNA polymerase subunit RPC12/RpoP [Phosphitispora fastidiosa]